MILRKTNAPSEHIGIDGAGLAFKLAGDYFHPVAPAELSEIYYKRGIAYSQLGNHVEADEDKARACALSRHHC